MDFKLGSDDDIDMTSLKLSMVSGAEEILQHIKIRLRFFYREWFLDASMGIPYKEQILVKNPDLRVVSALLKNTILNTSGVVSPLISFNSTYDPVARTLSVSFVASTTFGEVSLADYSLGVA